MQPQVKYSETPPSIHQKPLLVLLRLPHCGGRDVSIIARDCQDVNMICFFDIPAMANGAPKPTAASASAGLRLQASLLG